MPEVRALVGEPLRIKDAVRIRRMLDGLRLVTATSRLSIDDRGRARRADLLPCPPGFAAPSDQADDPGSYGTPLT